MRAAFRFVPLALAPLWLAAVAAADTHFVILGGLGGEPAYAERFVQQVKELAEICKKTAGDESLVHALYGNAAKRDAVESLLGSLTAEGAPDDALVVFLIGHGSYDGFDYKFNIPGPDLTAARLKKLLDAVPARDQLVVNMTSASGASIDWLQSDRRVVITATKSGRERTITVFPEFWLEGLQSPSADTDKNDTITALEAFQFAERKVKEFYESHKRLATEHARLEGDQASTFTLARVGAALEASADPQAQGLLAQREDLERQVEDLRRRKEEIEPQQYEQELERLLIQLARVQAQIDAAAEKN